MFKAKVYFMERLSQVTVSCAILQISAMCLPALGFGNPLTTMYASPIVSI